MPKVPRTIPLSHLPLLYRTVIGFRKKKYVAWFGKLVLNSTSAVPAYSFVSLRGDVQLHCCMSGIAQGIPVYHYLRITALHRYAVQNICTPTVKSYTFMIIVDTKQIKHVLCYAKA